MEVGDNRFPIFWSGRLDGKPSHLHRQGRSYRGGVGKRLPQPFPARSVLENGRGTDSSAFGVLSTSIIGGIGDNGSSTALRIRLRFLSSFGPDRQNDDGSWKLGQLSIASSAWTRESRRRGIRQIHPGMAFFEQKAMGKALGAEVVEILHQLPILSSFLQLGADHFGFYFKEANGFQMAIPLAQLFVVPD